VRAKKNRQEKIGFKISNMIAKIAPFIPNPNISFQNGTIYALSFFKRRLLELKDNYELCWTATAYLYRKVFCEDFFGFFRLIQFTTKQLVTVKEVCSSLECY
jgi:hypothetical protein